MKKIYIDTSSNKEVIVSLKIGENEYQVKQELTTRKAQIILPIIVQLLKDNNLDLKDIDAIELHPGPGSFTGVRVGVSVANALSYALGIPVNGKVFEKDGELVEPVYS